MSDTHQPQPDNTIFGAPMWVRILQALVIGIVAGLALNALLSMVVLQGEGMDGSQPKQCKKAAPAKDASTPPPGGSVLSQYRWSFEGIQAHGAWPQLPTAEAQFSTGGGAGN
jgi:hypothetical protein